MNIEEKKKIRELQSQARKDRLELMNKRNDLLSTQMLSETSGGIRDISTNKTLVKAKTRWFSNKTIIRVL